MMTILFSKWFNSSDDVQWMNTGTSDLYSTCQDVYCLIKNKEVSLQSKLSDVFVSYIGYIYQDNDELKMTHLKNLVNQGKLKKTNNVLTIKDATPILKSLSFL